jgi:hypothetical protein
MNAHEQIEAISNPKYWRQIEQGARECMWRYSGPFGTILLSDYSMPPTSLTAEDFLKEIGLWNEEY